MTSSSYAFDPQQFYSDHGQISDPGPYSSLLDQLPKDLPSIVKIIQGLMLHLHWAAEQGITLNRNRKEETNIRTAKDRLAKILELNASSLSQERTLSAKTVGTCRDFTLLLATILRFQGVPARCRAGFGKYFTKGQYIDHWVCEYWHSAEGRWIMVDPQLDEMQIEKLNINFNPLDVPRVQFVTGPQAWELCRSKRADPKRFGIFRMKGLDFVKGDLIRDFLALNKVEILPWDNFMLINKSIIHMNPTEKALMDRLAKISTGDDGDFVMVRAAFAANQERLLPRYFL